MRTAVCVLLITVLALGGGADGATNCSGPLVVCKDGIIVPMWLPTGNLSTGDTIARALIYFLALGYIFLGVSVVCDKFMAAIETITSQEREVTVKKPNGERVKVTYRIWNETVSNLTLMALGSSAPEIMLSVIEVCGNKFNAGDLGPNTIVGSAAFNLFMITAICCWVVPSDEIRRQKHLAVFFVTATWSVFAYIWLYLILSVFSYGVIEVWEGLLTFLFFPVTVLTAYMMDRKVVVTKFLAKQFRSTRRGVITAVEGPELEMGAADGEAGAGAGHGQKEGHKLLPQEDLDPEVKAFEQHRREFIELLKELRRKHPNADLDTLQQMAEYEYINRGPKSRAFYRVQATRKLMGGGNIVKKKLEKEHHQRGEEEAAAKAAAARSSSGTDLTCRILFDPAHYTVLENVGKFNVTVSREGGPPDVTVLVDFATEDGTANAGSDYLPAQGTLTFHPEDRHHVIPIEVIDDDVFEEDEHFYIHLSNLRIKTKDGVIIDPKKIGGVPVAELATPATATVMILDDDHAGVFSFEQAEATVVESAGHAHLKVVRSSGARGKVLIPYRTIDGTAKGDKDFERIDGQIIFDNDQTEQTIAIGIVDDEEYEKNEEFYVELGEPIWAKKQSDQQKVIERYLRRQRKKQALQADGDKSSVDSALQETKEQSEDEKIADLGKPRLGEIIKCAVRIRENKEFQGVVDTMLKTANASLIVGTSSWREQFVEALSVSAGEEDGGEEGEEGEKEEKLPSCGDYAMHFISLPWKVLCAFIPPTEYWNGWACFIVSIAMIGLATALIGDLANHFGCTIGLKDSVTALSFVALGTSLPDTFASKVSALQDKYADNSIGNVTGSNAVNVFLGVGLAWLLASIYHSATGSVFEVSPGTLAFSVTIFCTEAVVCILVIVLRRLPMVGGELGGPLMYKIPTVILFVSLWMIYVVVSALESYCYISGF